VILRLPRLEWLQEPLVDDCRVDAAVAGLVWESDPDPDPDPDPDSDPTQNCDFGPCLFEGRLTRTQCQRAIKCRARPPEWTVVGVDGTAKVWM